LYEGDTRDTRLNKIERSIKEEGLQRIDQIEGIDFRLLKAETQLDMIPMIEEKIS
jgi:hypothetical protein